MTSKTEFIESLKGSITHGEVLLPGSPGYAEVGLPMLGANLGLQNVVKPANPNEVSAAVIFAVLRTLPLAVRCGGHSSKGASSPSEGLVIDMSLMRTFDVNPDERTAIIAWGCLISDVNKATTLYDLAAVTGSENTVGYAGLTLGGGYGFLTGTHGLGCDNVLEVEVVLADGSIVTASEKQNEGLFWALRGAGANFGVCTKFKSRLYPQGGAWAGFLVFSLDQLSCVVDFVNHMRQSHSGKEGLLFGPCTPPPAFVPLIMVLVFFNGSEEDGRKYFGPLLELGPLANLTPYAS